MRNANGNERQKRVPLTEPGTPHFQKLLAATHALIAEDMDTKVRCGLHEPGHGSSHMEMTLYYTIHLADLCRLPRTQRDVLCLAAILHDIWRQGIGQSHTLKSALRAEEILTTQPLFTQQYPLSHKWVAQVKALVLSHSIQSKRHQETEMPPDWSLALQVLKTADLFAQGGPFGFLRSFSYSGHVLKDMLARIRRVVSDPKKFQDPLPHNLKRFFGFSDNYLHGWILSIMYKTNNKYINTLRDPRSIRHFQLLIASGVEPQFLQRIFNKMQTELPDNDKHMPTNQNPTKIDFGSSPIGPQILYVAEQSHKYSHYFNSFINDLNEFSKRTMGDSNQVSRELENDILRLLEYGIPGICSRMFWGQFNPAQTAQDDRHSDRYLSLPERIIKFSNLLDELGGSPHKSGIISQAGKDLFTKAYAHSRQLVEEALDQYNNQRWQTHKWIEQYG